MLLSRAAATEAAPMTVYLERKVLGLCTRGKCTQPIVDGSSLCARHLRSERGRMKAAARARRKMNRKRKLCADCGRSCPDTYRCAACAIKVAQVPRTKRPRVTTGVTHGDARFRVSTDGRTRFHGSKRRGRQPHAELHADDFRDAFRELSRAKDAVALLSSPEVMAMGTAERARIRAAADDRVRIAQGVLDDVRVRLGGLPAPADEDDE